MSVKDPLTLWCLVITDPFPINVGRRTVIANLKEAIKGKRDDLLHGVDASKLVLWKVSLIFNRGLQTFRLMVPHRHFAILKACLYL